MQERFRKDKILTIPNIMSLFRILLIPLILWLYLVRQKYVWAVVVIGLSALTDILDGYIARKFDMISDLGKVLDPIADKLTQGTLILCLIRRYPMMLPMILLFAVKELVMLIMGAVVLKQTDTMNGAKWYGKVCTVIICVTMMILILIPTVPVPIANAMIYVCMAAVVASLVLYLCFYGSILKKNRTE